MHTPPYAHHAHHAHTIIHTPPYEHHHTYTTIRTPPYAHHHMHPPYAHHKNSDNISPLMRCFMHMANPSTIAMGTRFHTRHTTSSKPVWLYASRQIPKSQPTDSKIGAWSKPGCMIGKVHNSTSLWRIWDPEFKAVKSQSEVILKKNGMHHEQLIS